MRIALLGDIHGNADAFEVVCAAARREGADRYLLTGDFVGYYYEPLAVLDMVRELPGWQVLGNHDEMLLDCLDDATRLSRIRKKYGSGLDKALEQFREDEFAFLRNLPRSVSIPFEGRNVLLGHGAPWSTDFYVYPDAPDDVWARIDEASEDVVVLGHSHYQFDRALPNTLVINPGSVGQPRDRKPGAAWSMLDLDTNEVTHYRESYDMSPLIERIRQTDPHLPILETMLTRQ